MQSSYHKDEISITIAGKNANDVAKLAGDIQDTAILTELDSGVEVKLRVTASPIIEGQILSLSPQTWDRSKWHKLRVRQPSVGRIDGPARAGEYYGARFIYVSYLTVARVEVDGQFGHVSDDAITMYMSERTQRPANEDVAVYQGGTRLVCSVRDLFDASVVWDYTCAGINWEEEFEIHVSGTFAGVDLRDLQGNQGWKARIRLPSDYASQAKWYYWFPQEGAGI